MKQWLFVGVLTAAVGVGAAAQQQYPAGQTAKPTTQAPSQPAAPAAKAPEPQKPAMKEEQPEKPKAAKARRRATGEAAGGPHKAPLPQPNVEAPADVPMGEMTLGSVRIPRSVKANGQALAAGTYQVKLTAQEAKPDVVGQTESHERWVEFLRGNQVVGREVVTIIPKAEANKVVKDAPPPPGGNKVQMLAGNDYLRVWINRGGNHYIINLPPA